MKETTQIIKTVDVTKLNTTTYQKRFVGCVVLSHDNKILLQQRGEGWKNYPGYLSEFGGHIEPDETPMEALIRELNEELGAIVDAPSVTSLGAISEAMTNHMHLSWCLYRIFTVRHLAA